MNFKIYLPILLIGAFSNVGVSQEAVGGSQNSVVPHPSAQSSLQASTAMLHKAFPGGRDESDLTVQPHKRITKHEAQGDESVEGLEPEPESTGDTEDFGE